MGNRVVRVLAAAGLLPLAIGAQTVVNGGRQILGTWDASGAASTRPAKVGTSLPPACAVGEQFFKTDAAAGQNLFLCTGTDTWTQISGGGGGGAGLPGMTGNAGKLLTNDGSAALWTALAPPSYPRTPFSPAAHLVDWFPYCNASITMAGQLNWQRLGSNFKLDCAPPVSGTIASGVSLKADTSGAYALTLSGLTSDYVNPAHSNRWIVEYEFAADATMETGQMGLGLADLTVATTYIALTHNNGEGFNLCIFSPGKQKCFNGVAAWDTDRHTVRFERVSESLLRARIDGGVWYNWHSGSGTDGPNDLYSVSFFSTNLRPQVWANPGEAVAKTFYLRRFELVYGY
ncbi:MAG: hypothetical protein ACM3S5_17225 [Rhodospirillales bacterium]